MPPFRAFSPCSPVLRPSWPCPSPPPGAETVNVAVAANFTDAAQEIARAFRTTTGHEAVLSFGNSAQLLTQIGQEAPFQVFLSADEERPRKAVEGELAVAESRFTYAVGKARVVEPRPRGS